eukprot:TRINITY_DN6866_c0_g1_i1.p1 TRINITY_DN6866_c0_g1~~TRINITY_DN6866_c0_g1_i1.p1  ORF type:complete len:527 (+),score=61.61 TRINITY_DN6866_c0_g1_i1:93-1673(+)
MSPTGDSARSRSERRGQKSIRVTSASEVTRTGRVWAPAAQSHREHTFVRGTCRVWRPPSRTKVTTELKGKSFRFLRGVSYDAFACEDKLEAAPGTASTLPARAKRWSTGERRRAVSAAARIVAQPCADQGVHVCCDTLRDLRVRDLCWVLDVQNSLLVSPSCAVGAQDVWHVDEHLLRALLPALRTRLLTLDHEPAELHAWLQKRASSGHFAFVGKYFEDLVLFAFHRLSANSCAVVLQNHCIPSETRETPIGEVDVILKAHVPRQAEITSPAASGKSVNEDKTPLPALHHLELACKFYLVVPRPGATGEVEGSAQRESQLMSGWNQMVDPEGNTFAEKYSKMRDIQVRWSAKPPLRDELGSTPQPWLWMQGRLFEHFTLLARPLGAALVECDPNTSPRCCNGVSRTCKVGWWCFTDELRDCLDSFDTSVYRCLPLRKPFWLAPVELIGQKHEDHGATLPVRTLVARHSSRSRAGQPILIAILACAEGTWKEVHRGFVMPRSWPSASEKATAAEAIGPTWLQPYMR